MKVKLTLATVLLVSGPVLAQGQQVWTELSVTGGTNSLAYSECSPEECFGEAVTHVLGCGVGVDGYFELVNTDGMRMASEIADLEWGQTAVTLTSGASVASSPVSQMLLTKNDMNGTWDLALQGYEFSSFFRVLAEAPVGQPATLSVMGTQYDLTPNAEAGRKLKAVAALCSQSDVG